MCIGRPGGRIAIDPDPLLPEARQMLHMQHAQVALLLMERPEKPAIKFTGEDREHQRQLERVRDSLLRGVDVKSAKHA